MCATESTRESCSLIRFGVTLLPPPMISEMVLPAESFAAYITWIRSFVCVRTLVNQQVVRLGEVAVAVTTDVLLLVPVWGNNVTEVF